MELYALAVLNEEGHRQGGTREVLVLGGSVTDGVGTWGCCCDQTLDVKFSTPEEIELTRTVSMFHFPHANRPLEYCNAVAKNVTAYDKSKGGKSVHVD